MRRKKKSNKKKVDHPALMTAEEDLVNSLLEDCKTADPSDIAARIPDPRLARIFLDRLSLNDAFPVPLLSAVDKAFDDKHVHKAVKKILFRLKKKGISVNDNFSQKSSHHTVIKRVRKEELVAYIGPITGTSGSRAVLIILHNAIRGNHSGIGLVSESEGIQQFLYGAFSKKRTREIKDALSQEAGPLVETALPHAATILEAAYQHHMERHSEVPAQYLELRPWLLENITLLPQPMIYSFVSEIPDSDGTLTDNQLGKLFDHNLMRTWLIDFESLQPFMESILKVNNSTIVLSDTQKMDQIRQIKEKCIQELFPGPRRSLLKHNLEEMAYFFFKLDQGEYSRMALNAAQTLDLEDTTLKKNVIIDFMVEQSMGFYMNLAREEGARDGSQEADDSPRIILP